MDSKAPTRKRFLWNIQEAQTLDTYRSIAMISICPSDSFCIAFKNNNKKKHTENKTKHPLQKKNKKLENRNVSVSMGKKEEKKTHLSHTLWFHRSSTHDCFRSFNSTCALVLSVQTTSSARCGRTMSCSLPSSTIKNR